MTDRREWDRRYRIENAERIKASRVDRDRRRREAIKADPVRREQERERQRASFQRRKNIPEKYEAMKERSRRYWAKHRDQRGLKAREWYRALTAERKAERAARNALAMALGVSPSSIPQEMVDAKKLHLRVKRAVLDAGGSVGEVGGRPPGKAHVSY